MNEAAVEVIEAGDLVVVKSNVQPDMSRGSGLAEAAQNGVICDVIGRGYHGLLEINVPGYAADEFFIVEDDEIELADIDALTIAENSDLPEAVELVGELLIQKSLHESVVNTYEARLADYARECEALQARVTLLTERLTPFAMAALDEDVVNEFPGVNLLTEERMLCMYINHDEQHPHDDETHFLKVRHLKEALEVLPDVAGSANAADESA